MKGPIYIVRSQEDGDYLEKQGLIKSWNGGSFNHRTRWWACNFLYMTKYGFMQGTEAGVDIYKSEGYTTFLEPHEYREDLQRDVFPDTYHEDLESPIHTEPVDDNDLTLSELAEKLRPMRDTYVPYLDRVALERKEAEEKLIAEVSRGRE